MSIMRPEEARAAAHDSALGSHEEEITAAMRDAINKGLCHCDIKFPRDTYSRGNVIMLLSTAGYKFISDDEMQLYARYGSRLPDAWFTDNADSTGSHSVKLTISW